MTVGYAAASFRRSGQWLAIGIAAAALLAACGGSASPRPTDPSLILTNSIAATAAVPTVKLHAEVTATMAGFGAANAHMQMALDADVDVATRQFVGRSTTRLPGELINAGAQAAVQVSEMIVTQTASFSRDSQTGRWMKVGGAGFAGGPSNVQVATMISNLLSNPALTFEMAEAGSCSLGTCDHVIVHVDGRALAPALGPLLGAPVDASMAQMVPSFDIDVLVDQSTSIVSELRTSLSMQGSSTSLLLTLSNPGIPVQIVPPPAALTDDFGMGNGPCLGCAFGGGGQVTTILETVGSEVEATPMLSDGPSSVESPSAP
ncbi:MAG: hypothetical protein H0V73_10420 [Chloroflexi bacterium]|nr:hypothetical protein [Chloroflexota bacterium]